MKEREWKNHLGPCTSSKGGFKMRLGNIDIFRFYAQGHKQKFHCHLKTTGVDIHRFCFFDRLCIVIGGIKN